MLTTLTLAALLCPAALASDGGGVPWADGFGAALEEAGAADGLVLLAFVPEWSEYSQRLVTETFADPSVVAALDGYACLKYEVDGDEAAALSTRFNVSSFPTVVVADASGEIEDAIYGFVPPAILVSELQRIRGGTNTVSSLRRRVDEAPDDLARRYALVLKLENVGDTRRAARERQRVRDADPEGTTVAGARVLLDEAWGEVLAKGPGSGASCDLTPVERLVEEARHDALRFEGYNRIADYLRGQDRGDEARDAYRRAWGAIPDAALLDWTNQVGWILVDMAEGGMDEDDRALGLELARASVARAERALDDEDPSVSPPTGVTDRPAWLAERLDLLVFALYRFDDTEEGLGEALDLCRRCMELAPDNEEYPRRLEMLRSRAS